MISVKYLKCLLLYRETNKSEYVPEDFGQINKNEENSINKLSNESLFASTENRENKTLKSLTKDQS